MLERILQLTPGGRGGGVILPVASCYRDHVKFQLCVGYMCCLWPSATLGKRSKQLTHIGTQIWVGGGGTICCPQPLEGKGFPLPAAVYNGGWGVPYCYLLSTCRGWGYPTVTCCLLLLPPLLLERVVPSCSCHPSYRAYREVDLRLQLQSFLWGWGGGAPLAAIISM